MLVAGECKEARVYADMDKRDIVFCLHGGFGE